MFLLLMVEKLHWIICYLKQQEAAKNVCLSGCLLMTTEGLLLLVFSEVSAFLFLCMTFPGNRITSFS